MNEVVFNKLEKTRKNLLKEIPNLEYEAFNYRPDTNKWSIAQVCQHLVLVEEATVKAVAWGIKENDRTEKDRKEINLALNRKKKIKSPKIVRPVDKPFTIREIKDMLSESRKSLLALLDSIENKSILDKNSVKHPVFGELPLDQWVELVYLHEQRHIEQIKEIKLELVK